MKLFYFIFLMVFSLTTTFAFATKKSNGLKGSFSGKITTSNGDAIIGASIYFTDIKVGSVTDGNGHFIFQNIPEGKHLIEISHVGYSTIIEPIEINGDTKKDFVLSQMVVENNAVIVTGVGSATTSKKIPFSVVSIGKQAIFQTASTNLMESIAKIGGVSTLATGPAISKPVIRGLGYNRVLTINDGVRQEGQQWGDEHGIEIDEASASKVELLKGPASLIYGSDAMAGVLNIITNIPVANNTIKGNVNSNYQTNNRLRSVNANVSGNKNGFNWNIYSSNRAAADYKNKYDGYVYNSKFKENNVGGYVGYNGNWGYSHLLVSSFNLKTGLVEGERDNEGSFIKSITGGGFAKATIDDFKSTTPQIPYQHIRHFKITTDNNFKLNKNRLSINVGFQQNKREEFGNIDDLSERALFFDLKTITYTAQLHLAEKNGFKTSIGSNGMQQNNTNKGIEQLIPNYTLFDFGGYVYTQKTIKKLTLSGGLRFNARNIDAKNLLDGTSIKGDAFKKTFSNVSGSIGLAAQATDKLNVKFNIARAFRAPSIPELASNGAHEGTIRYEYGNATLKSETSIQLDAGIDYTTEHVSLGLNLFYNHFTNFIFYRKLEAIGGGDSLINVNGSDLTAFKFDQQSATLAGFEATVDIHPHPLDWLHIQNTFSLVSGAFTKAIESTKNLPFIPAPKLVTEFRGNFKSINAAIKNVYAKLELDNTFTQNKIFTAYNTETRTSGYTLLNIGVGADVVNKKGNTVVNIAVSGLNLADVAYQNHLSRLKYAAENMATGRNGVFNMGRNFSIKVNIPFTGKL
jgi:iron complex outermembrane recepter protein